MNSLLPGEIKGYIVRKMVGELKAGDVLFVGNLVDIVEKIETAKHGIIITAGKVSMSSERKSFVNCIQKEDPAIQLAIEAKLEVLQKHKAISASNNNHEVLRNGDRLTTSGEWIKQGKPHQWSIIETEGEYEYWEDSAYEVKVLWAGNKIIAWNDCKKKQLSMYKLISKEGVCVFDKLTYDLPKYIWR